MGLNAESRAALVRVKIERAKKNLVELEALLAGFRGKKIPVMTIRQDVSKIEKLPVLPFEALPISGDIIHNLRSALNHLAHQLVLVGTSGTEPSRRVEFPISKDVMTYEAEKVAKMEGMRLEAVKTIDSLHPYKGGNDTLWRIHELNNIDKHRTLFTVDHDVLLVSDWQSYPYFFVAEQNPHFAGVFDRDVEKDMQLEIEESVRDMHIAKGNALLPTLHQLVNFVDELPTKFLPLLE